MKELESRKMKKAKWIYGVFILLALPLLFIGCQDIENEVADDMPFLKSAETIEVAGDVFLSPTKFIREKGEPVVQTLTINENIVDNFAPDFNLYLKNGDEEGNRVSSAIVKLDGKQLFGPADFSQEVDQLSVPLSGITAESVLEVEVRGAPNGFVEIWIEGTLLEEENTYRIYFSSISNGLIGIKDDGTISNLYQHPGRMVKVQAHNQKLYTQINSLALDAWAMHVLDYEGNLLEILEFPEEVTWTVGFTILPDGRFAVYNNDDDVVYFLNPDFTYQTEIQVRRTSSRQVMRGIVVDNDLIICEDGYRKLLKIDLSTNEVSEFRNFSQLDESFLGSLAYSEGVYYLGGRENIYSFKEGEPEKLVVKFPTYSNVDIEIDGQYAYVASNFGGKIYKVDLTDGSFEDIASGYRPEDIEIIK